MRYSVDAICRYYKTNLFVVIRRLNVPTGLAFPGGGIEEGENKDVAIARELKEETGLTLASIAWLPKVYNEEGRDPRFPSTSFVAYGEAFGTIIPEKGKTEVLLLSKEEILAKKELFVFDHFQIFLDYLALLCAK